MNLQQHIATKIFIPRLDEKRVLVVYDQEGRFTELCKGLESDQCRVILTDKRPISSRQDAMERWKEMVEDTTYQSQMLIHCLEAPPKDNDERQQRPFAAYAAVGDSFPSRASDDFKQLCYGFLKDRTVEIDQLFASGTAPTFDMIDNLAGGAHSHPRLESIFGSADPSKIVPDFLVPPVGSAIPESLNAGAEWFSELHQLLDRTLGLTLNPQVTSADTIRKKLWRYLLISEFANDLPGSMPSELQDLPLAQGPQLLFALDLCQGLRVHMEKKETYKEAACTVEQELQLESICAQIVDLGNTDTFEFEEKRFLDRAATAIRAEEWDAAKAVLDSHKKSIWTEEGERSLLWRILELGLSTLEEIIRAENQIPHIGHSGKDLSSAYESDLVRVERSYRELEVAHAQVVESQDEIESIILATRSAYRAYFNSLENRFLTTVQREGWPLKDMEANIQSFDKHVAPMLKNGSRIVYFMVDALRLDLAQDLETSLQGHQVRCTTACANLPCVTRFGMASLLPEADQKLRFMEKASELRPFYGEKDVKERSDRLSVFESVYNDRVSSSNLDDFIKKTSTPKKREALAKSLSETDLFVLTSTELDSLGEGSTTTHLQHIPIEMQKIQLGIKRCGELDFDMAVLATDHGFVWIEDQDSGSVCEKPAGSWKLTKRRCLMGEGDEAPGTMRFQTSSLSIPTDLSSFVTPKALATFTNGSGYFHEGLSLQESLVPRLIVTFQKSSADRTRSPSASDVQISSKKKTASARIFSITLSWPGTADMFSEGSEVKLVALQDKQEVGFPTSSEHVDATSGLVKINPGQSIKLSIRLGEDVPEGPITIKAIDPETDLAIDSYSMKFEPLVF